MQKFRKRTFNASATIVLLALLATFGAYGSGYRVTVWPPDNYWVCEGAVDRPAGYKPPTLSDEEKREADIQFEKSCPGFNSGWFWGEWTITKPLPDSRTYETVLRGTFWRPYYGFIWPDNNLGRAGLYFTNTN